MTAITDTRLAELGDALERAARADLRSAAGHDRRRRRRIVLGLVAAAVVIPGAAIGATQLLTADDVARSLPAGTRMLGGTHPVCAAVRDQAEYDCRLERAPAGEIAPGGFQGTVEPTVDATKHVNGGCRSLNAAGTHWRCYVGQEAVRPRIVDAGFLGAYAPAPGVG